MKAQPAFKVWVIFGLLLAASLPCSLSEGGGNGAEATAQAIAIQSTALALQMTQQAQDLQTTLSVQPDSTPASPGGRPSNLDELRKNARILLFEDVLKVQTKLERHVKQALDEGGYTDLSAEAVLQRGCGSVANALIRGFCLYSRPFADKSCAGMACAFQNTWLI